MRPPEREEQVQQCIMDGLRLRGFTVLSTSVRHKRTACRKCGAWSTFGGLGTTPGVPDLLVTHPAFPAGVFIGIEVKGTRTPLSAAQRQLALENRIVICRRWEDAEAAIGEAMKALGVKA